ncbi:hypothetical protein EW146_g3905 [Bondarzewia mesenterica]|uniref:UvrD-like helicase ATP-binding domain-containing protein n=1 Tax=Bondarzewia mesenterica TaxID=1095465 RepID=A0A4V3XFA6_9AGAM|nr:hypothetical protein EW146_g3905 [Bondarzewia mesenterica]
MDVQVPSNSEAARELASKILSDQRGILKYFLDIFRRPDLQVMFKKMYLDTATAAAKDAHEVETPTSPYSSMEEASPVTPFIYASPSLKAALYFESADEFGDWRIFLSGRAEKDLRRLRKGDASVFEIVWNKLKELSNAQFSGTNQKKITGSQVPIPIFEARLPGDSRIVYQVDWVQEFGMQSGHQVLNIFGIYNHVEISSQFWDKFSRMKAHVEGKGYRDLCRLRDHPRHAGENVFSPISIPLPVGEELAGELPTDFPDVSTKDLAEFHSLLALEKYVALSQNVLKGLLSNEDVAHIFRVSPHEQQVIEHTGSCYVLGRSGTGKTTTMLFKMFGIERAWIQSGCVGPRPRQIFVTKSRTLAEKVEEYFIRFVRSLAEESRVPPHVTDLLMRSAKRGERGMVDAEEDATWRSDLPDKYSQLADEHYPLFITIDGLGALIEADKNEELSRGSSRLKSRSKATISRPLISFEVFKNEYWPHFPQHLKKGLSPSLVFGQMLGVIRGSQETLRHGKHELDRETYFSICSRTLQMSSSDTYDAIYDLFSSYVKRKAQHGDRDAADRTHAVLDTIRERGIIGEKVDFLYVDEVQDLLLIDVSFLRCICKNPDGLFWAGDTAQTISFGSAFRFNDLTSLLYTMEKRSRSRRQAPTKPEFFQLLTNYRSHAGIVNCAHSIVELIANFWPYSIDKLDRETGLVDGIKPIFVDDWDETQFHKFFTESGEQRIQELGEHQCILVRDDAAKEKLEQRIGDMGTVLTLYESKGLEFDDVLLYDFFADSNINTNQWRRVVEAALANSWRSEVGSQNVGVGNELKFLYVAITRTRRKLLFVDQHEVDIPMKAYWIEKHLVEVQSTDDALSNFAAPSKPEEWIERARMYFARHQYNQASKAFRRAKMPREEAIATAYDLRGRAQRETKHRYRALGDAADAFYACGLDAKNENEIRTYFRIAGECYAEARIFHRAAEAYENASLYTEAVSYYRDARRLDDAVSILKAHEAEIESDVAERVKNTARCAYLNEGNLDEASELFKNEEEQETFMVDFDFGTAYAQFLEKKGDYVAAAKIYLQERQVVVAIEILLKDRLNQESFGEALGHLLDALWCHLSFGVHPDTQTPNLELQDLFRLLELMHPGISNSRDKLEVKMFQAIHDADKESLKDVAVELCRAQDNKPATLLCLDHLFGDLCPLLVDTEEQVIFSQFLFLNYTRLMHEIIMYPDPGNSKAMQRLFAFRPASEDHLILAGGTYMRDCFGKENASGPSTNLDGDARVFSWHFRQMFRHNLVERLRGRTLPEGIIISITKLFEPCPYASLPGQCKKDGCTYIHKLDAAWYIRRVRFHLQQIGILHFFQSLPGADDFPTRIRARRRWLDRLGGVLNPFFYHTGPASTVRVDDIQEAQLVFQPLQQWINDILYTLNPRREELQARFLTNFLEATTIGYLLNRNAVNSYLHRLPYVRYERHPMLERDNGAVYVLHSLVAFMTGSDQRDLFYGAKFFGHLVESRIPIHVRTLCHLLDRICGIFVLALNFRSKKTLHGVTLPRTWFVELWEDFGRCRTKASGNYRMIVDSIPRLLEDIYKWDTISNGLHYFKPHDIPYQVAKNMCLARICKAVCLLGYNINDETLRREIHKAITSLRRKDPMRVFHPIYSSYVWANSWDDLARVVRVSITDSPFDEMVQLFSELAASQRPAPRGVKRVFFRRLEDVPLLLDPDSHYRLPAFKTRCTSRTEYTTHVTEAHGIPTVRTAEIIQEEDVGLHPDDASEEEGEVAQDVNEQQTEDDLDQQDAIPDLHANADTEAGSSITSENEQKAATVIQRAYRLALERRGGAAKRGFAAVRARIFRAYLNESRNIDWTVKSHRAVYLGILPHLVFCLEWMRDAAKGSKERVKKNRKADATPDALDEGLEVMKNMNNVLALLKPFFVLLEPKSPFHRHFDLRELRDHAEKARELMDGLPQSHQIKGDMDLVKKGLSIRRMGQVKPDLNVEDL